MTRIWCSDGAELDRHVWGRVISCFCPDQKSGQVLHCAVEANIEKVTIKMKAQLDLLFAPSGRGVHPDGFRIIVSGAEEGTSYASPAKLLGNGDLQGVT